MAKVWRNKCAWSRGTPAAARHYVAPDPPDGFVDITDIVRLAGLFGQNCVQEPGGASLSSLELRGVNTDSLTSPLAPRLIRGAAQGYQAAAH